MPPQRDQARAPLADSTQPIRVVVCDDSPFMRRMLRTGFESDRGVEVVGSAANGEEAVALCTALRPDVLTLDMELPDLDGVQVLQQIRHLPTRVLVVSAFTSERENERAVAALSEGAIDVIGKPGVGEPPAVFFAQVLARVHDVAVGAPYVPAVPVRRGGFAGRQPARQLVVIGASTGGPRALHALLPSIPGDFPAPIVLVQHMPPTFTSLFAARLNSVCELDVHSAVDGERLMPGTVHVAVPGCHLHVDAEHVYVREGDRVNGLVPAVDVTLIDAATTWGASVTAVVLTGIGRDGREGARAVSAAGGRVLVEDESTAAVFGMPRAVLDAGLADASVPLHDIAEELVKGVVDA